VALAPPGGGVVAIDGLHHATTPGLHAWIRAGGGNDQLHGTPGGFDAFVFASAPNALTNQDTIFGFETSGLLPDQIWLDRTIFPGLPSQNGLLSSTAFSANANGLASAALAQITYNTTAGVLAFDPDGTGQTTATPFARLNGRESLTAARIRLFSGTPPAANYPRAGTFTKTMLKDAPGGSTLRLSSLLTVGESTAGLPSSDIPYLPPGRMDGMGAYDNGDGTITLLVNHELQATDGSAINVTGLNANVTGARISRFVIAKDLDNNPANGYQARVLSGGLAYDEVKSVDPTFARGGLTRLCGANLSNPLQFGAGRGFVDRLSFVGEEGGPGRFFALDTANTDLHHVPAFGRGNWECGLAVDTGSANTVAVMLFDDTSGTANYLYLWVGTKAPASADLLRRNGIDASSGALYAWKAESISSQTALNAVALNTPVAGHWERLGSGTEIAALPSAASLRGLAQARGAMAFVRIEDGDVSPITGQQVAFNTTGGSGADLYGNTNLMDLSSAFAAYGSLRTTANTSSLKVIGDADRLTGLARQGGVRNPDNIAWARNGKLYIQEDRAVPGGTADGQFGSQEASIWEVDPVTGATQRWAQVDRTAVPTAYGQSDSQPLDIGNWETSGIIEVSSLFGAPAGTLFLTTVMAHSLTNGSIG
ncbi:MAG: alkaline phosphatase PhoX, partial [Cyanobium sp.]